MIVPGQLPGSDAASPMGQPEAMPSQTSLLMAAAEMHKRGRLVQSGPAPPPRTALPKRPRPQRSR
jgi:hypothetical protein